MTDAQLAQLYHELSRIEREIMQATDVAAQLKKENEQLKLENERLKDDLALWQFRATSLGGDHV